MLSWKAKLLLRLTLLKLRTLMSERVEIRLEAAIATIKYHSGILNNHEGRITALEQ